MMPARDQGPTFDEVAAAALAACPDILYRWLPAGRLNGHEFEIGDVQGNPGDSCKVNIDTGKWSDFAADQSGGDLLSLYAAVFGYDNMGRACRALAEELGLSEHRQGGATVEPIRQNDKTRWTPVHPVPDDAPGPTFEHYKHGRPSATWAYRDAQGRVLGHVCRFDKDGGGKEILPFTFCTSDDGRRQWRWLSFAKPRPLYGLDRLAANPQANVIVCEGEKAADAAQRLFPSQVVVTWPGGSKAIKHADWSALQGRKVVLWPDADRPGRQAMDGWLDDHGLWKDGIAQMLASVAAGVRVLEPGDDRPEGWDAADAEAEGWAPDQALEFLRAGLRAPSEAPVHADAPPPAGEDDYGEVSHPAPDNEANAFFRPLGYNRDRFYFLVRRGLQVIDLSARGIREKGNLFQLAPLQWWEREFPSEKGFTGNAVDRAADWLIKASYGAGLFNPDKLRGRGAWLDRGRSVLHLGDRLIVDGRTTDIAEFDCDFIYERSRAMADVEADPAGAREAHKLVEICSDLRWERGVHAKLLAGWIAIAPICGALQWRPSIWVTGASGSGKTYVLENIIRGALGNIAMPVQSKTSEAGIRQSLGRDALPVIFDEAEQEDLASRQRMQGVIDLVRQSSSETGADIVKGVQNQGDPKRFRVRSMFAFCSINVGLEHYADESRITTLTLTAPETGDPEQKALADAHFEELDRKVLATLTPEFGARLVARSVSLMQVIRENHRTFTQAVAHHLGNRRIGDQLGALLAGAYSLHSPRQISYADALAWVRKQDWSGTTAPDDDQDHLRLLSYILQARTRVSQASGNAVERNFGELIEAARRYDVEGGLSSDAARAHLLRNGIRHQSAFESVRGVDGEGVWISQSHFGMKRILHNTPWSTRWGEALARIPGAQKSGRTVRFGASGSSRAVFIPISQIEGDEP